jgi:hypothetical protein
MEGYATASQIAEKWGVTERYVQLLCKRGRIEKAVKFGNTWAIPEDAERLIVRAKQNKEKDVLYIR